MPIRYFILLSVLSTCIFPRIQAQNLESDSLINMSYEDLKKSVASHDQDSAKASIYANTYLKKAKIERDTLEMAIGHYLRLFTDKHTHRFDLYDTIINLSKNLKNRNFPTIAYYDKGTVYHKNFLYKSALDNYLKALEYNDGSNKDHMDFLLNQSIGLLKSRIDKNEEALKLMKSCWKYALEKNFKKESPLRYYNILYYLSNTYRKANYLDSARVYTRIGLLDKYRSDFSINYNHFLMLDAIIKTREDKFYEADAGFSRALPELTRVNDAANTALGYYFQGKNYVSLNQELQAVNSFKKVDSIFEKTGDIIPELVNGYQNIITYYNANNNLEKQLYYTQKLISVDSIISLQYKNLSNVMVNEYDIPKLMASKEELISQLELKNKHSKTSTIALISSLFLIIGIAVNQSKKRQSYKKRFEQLLNANPNNPSEKLITSDTNLIGVPNEIIDHILSKLSKFEEASTFKDSTITLSYLAKKLDTNTNYLSKVINHYKKNSFASYLKQLRVEYAFEKLKTEPTLRKYTIKAIAAECGFKGSESFSKTFYKAYGIYPSYFIKQLNKTPNLNKTA